MAEKATSAAFDFTDVRDGGGMFNKKRQAEGDYKAKVVAVADAKAKDDTPQWLFTIEVGTGKYPYYCKHQENQLWKIRNLLVAAGVSVPKKRVKVDPNVVVGKTIAVTLEDDEYDGKAQSSISATFPVSELHDDDIDDEDEDTEEEDEDEEEAPAPKKKAKPATVEEDDDEEEDEEPAEGDEFDAMNRTELKQHIARTKLAVEVRKSMSDDDIRAAIRAAAASDDDDDDLEEIDIDDA